MLLPLHPAAAYAAVAGRDGRWDGRLYLGVSTTGIYCRPSCPARTPRPENCQFFPTAAAAVAAGFRACRRCRPDSLPGSRHWDARGDLVGRAVRLIADGAVDDGGVPALARRLAVSERHLTRLLAAEVGATPAQLARTRRAHTARLLIEQTTLPLSDVAFAAGFGSIRQFNDAMLAEFGAAPRVFRRHAVGHVHERSDGVTSPTVTLRLTFRPPLALAPLRRTLAAHAIAGVERVLPDGAHERVVDAPSGPALVRLELGAQDRRDGADGTEGPASHTALVHAHAPLGAATPVSVALRLTRLDDLMPVVTRVRRWLDLDADPVQVDSHLAADPVLAPLVASRPGLRVPGAVDGHELAVCAVLGQQVSLAAARTFQGRIARAFGAPVAAGEPDGVELVTFPRADTLAAAGAQAIRDAAHLTQARARTIHGLSSAVADGALVLEPGADPAATRAALLALPGIGPWTADYLALRALRDPDAYLPSDLVLRKELAAHASLALREVTPAVANALAATWRPWRSYALQHLWTAAVYA